MPFIIAIKYIYKVNKDVQDFYQKNVLLKDKWRAKKVES